MNESNKTRIAHLAGPTATIQNTPPLVTSNKARAKRGLPLLKDADGAPLRHDALRPQRLAAPVKVYVEQFSAHLRSDKGDGDIPPEVRGTHFFGYKPYHLAVAPPRPALAKATNDMQALVSSGDYDGVIWTQGSPQVEESAYWFNLLIDTILP